MWDTGAVRWPARVGRACYPSPHAACRPHVGQRLVRGHRHPGDVQRILRPFRHGAGKRRRGASQEVIMFAGHAAVALAHDQCCRAGRSGCWLPPRSSSISSGRCCCSPASKKCGSIRQHGVHATGVRPLSWTHSLLTAIFWGLLFAFVALRGTTKPLRDFCWLAALVVSHWGLDLLTHRPDLPWRRAWRHSSVWASGTRFQGRCWSRARSSGRDCDVRPVDRGSRPRRRHRAVDMARADCRHLDVRPLFPAAPSATAVGIVGLLMWLFPFWAAWADRHRVPRQEL